MNLTLLEREDEHPQHVVDERAGGRRVVIMDSARWVDARNTARDVVVPASYVGVLPARMMAVHRPRGVIGHDACVGKDGAGIAGLWYLEALGIPAATADGMSAEMGNGADLHAHGVLSRVNFPAERCGLRPGMPVREAAERLCDVDLDAAGSEVGNKIRREVVEEDASGKRIVVTDSIVWAYPEDAKRSVLVTAGHTGRSGASFLLEADPWGFICHDGGMSKNRSGITGLDTTAEHWPSRGRRSTAAHRRSATRSPPGQEGPSALATTRPGTGGSPRACRSPRPRGGCSTGASGERRCRGRGRSSRS